VQEIQRDCKAQPGCEELFGYNWQNGPPPVDFSAEFSEHRRAVSAGCCVPVLQKNKTANFLAPRWFADPVLFHNLSGQIDSSMHRSRSAGESAKLMIEGSRIQLQNVNTLNPDSNLSQPAASQPASQPESERQMLWPAFAGHTICCTDHDLLLNPPSWWSKVLRFSCKT
jgi:hypothetical protein